MIIKVTEERECCDPAKDMKPYKGKQIIGYNATPFFCIHCGQLWGYKRVPDAAGGMESQRYKLNIEEVPE